MTVLLSSAIVEQLLIDKFNSIWSRGSNGKAPIQGEE
jgi:hypothetical protein